MKNLFLSFLVLLAIACNSDTKEPDSVEMAKEENREQAGGTDADTLGADKQFLVDAYSGTRMEVQLGNYAATNAASPAVKQFGKMMATEHMKADSAITIIARVKAIVIPNVAGNDHQQHIDELTRKKGAEFDKDYMKLMVEDHEEDIEKFEKAAKDASDPDIKKFAAESLPVLRKHLDAAKKIRDELK